MTVAAIVEEQEETNISKLADRNNRLTEIQTFLSLLAAAIISAIFVMESSELTSSCL